MSTQIEARSLTSLNYLAANPPQYPHKPAEQRQDPLTLYISRVPGTRDIILTTSKPHLKNVTSEDVANSFYYIHLELPGEGGHSYNRNVAAVAAAAAAAQPNHLRNPDTPRSSQDSARSANQIRRKPLPTGAKVPSPPADPARSYPPPPAGPGPHPGAYGYGPGHGPANDGRQPRWAEDRPDLQPALLQRPLSHSPPAPVRKPVGPRSIPTPAPDSDALPYSHPPDLHRPSSPRSPSRIPRESPSASSRRYSRPPAEASRTRQQSRSPSPNRFHNTTAVPYTISLIRRDPSTGNQWNVGRVSSHQLEDSGDDGYEYFSFDSAGLSAHERRRATAPQPPISIHLESSGYAKFRHMPLRPSVDAPRTSTSSPPFASSEDALAHLHQHQQQHPAEGGFSRQVVMSYAKSWTSNIREKFNARSRSGSVVDDPSAAAFGSPPPPPPAGARPANNRHSRQLSTHSTGSASSNASDSGPVITHPGAGLRPRGYVFVSPWDGRCEFRTGNGGRSVKCRHVLPQAGGGLSNPLAPSGSSSSNAAAVSELRFNLPSTELFRQEGKREQLSGHFSRLLKVGNRDGGEYSDDDEPPSPFDLRLGKERAGGGNRGKRAKLGKLIVYPEGLKMLDLVVAANMGVWWGAWEKTF
ncbi:hypothetical protein EsH8_I_000066 [Colletotrichum jinshuiense]